MKKNEYTPVDLLRTLVNVILALRAQSKTEVISRVHCKPNNTKVEVIYCSRSNEARVVEEDGSRPGSGSGIIGV